MLQIKRSIVEQVMKKFGLTELEVINRMREMAGQPEARWEILEDGTNK